jgi:hypothetical protein
MEYHLGRLVGCVELDLDADRTIIYLGGDRQVGYPNIVLVHDTDAARTHVSETLMPNDAKGLTGQVVNLPSDIFIWVVEDGDWRSRIDGRRRWWVDGWVSTWAAGGAAGTRRWRPRRLGGSDNRLSGSDNGFKQRRRRATKMFLDLCFRWILIACWGRADGAFGVASCNAMDTEHRLRQRIGVLSDGGADENHCKVILDQARAGHP